MHSAFSVSPPLRIIPCFRTITMLLAFLALFFC